MDSEKIFETNRDLEEARVKAANLGKLLQEVRRRQIAKKIDFYRPSEKQAQFHAAPHKYRLLPWGNGAGKTHALVHEAVSYCLGIRPWDGTRTKTPPCKVLIAGQDFVHAVKGSIVPILEEILPEGVLEETNPITRIHSGIPAQYNFKNGSILVLMSYKQDEGSVEGYEWDFVALNEPFPKWFWEGTRRGMRRAGSRAAFAMTMLEEPWIYDDIFVKCNADPEYWSNAATIFDNPAINAEERESWIKTLPPEMKDVRLYGKPKFLQGRIYKTYTTNVHLLDRTRFFANLEERKRKDSNFRSFDEWPKGRVIDPHTRRPFAIAWFAMSPSGEIIFFDEWPNTPYYETMESLTLDGYADLLFNREGSFPGGSKTVVYSFMDPNYGRTPNAVTGATLEDEFLDRGYFFETQISNDLESGHLAVQQKMDYDESKPVSSLNRPLFYVLSNCRNMNDAMLRYAWMPRGRSDVREPKEAPQERYKDFSDLARYAVMGEPFYFDFASRQVAGKRIPGATKGSWKIFGRK